MPRRKVCIVGLGYVGLSTAVAFGKSQRIMGFDKNAQRIAELKKYYDHNNEFSAPELKAAQINYTSDPKQLSKADFYITAVPTPVGNIHRPIFTLLKDVSTLLGKHIKKNSIIVFESTVYPGATEEICIPILEKTSHLKSGKDFFVGYSPERINPGDREHTLANTTKIISALDKKTLDIIAEVYGQVVKKLYRVSSIKVAEAAKVIENTQRDLNISLINEIALILHKLNIDTNEVLSAAATKWNFLPFKPGLVGGHCIGVDPYYLTYKAQEVGYHPDVILAGRRVNDLMGRFIAEQTIKLLIQQGIPVKRSRVAILGITFKENCADIRNSRIFDLIKELKSFDVEVLVHDPIANPKLVKAEYKIDLCKWNEITNIDAIILAVAHAQYKKIDASVFKHRLKNHGLIMDVKGILNPQKFANTGIKLWRL